MHEYFSTEKFLCSSLKKIIIGLPHLFSKLLRKAFLKDYFTSKPLTSFYLPPTTYYNQTLNAHNLSS